MVSLTRRSKLHESLDLPDWLVEYLDDCGHRLLGWQPGRPKHHGNLIPEEKPPKRGQGPGAIGRAAGFSEGLSLARHHWGGEFDEREKLALWVVRYMHEEGVSLDSAATEAENARLASRSTARRAVEKARTFALRRMQEQLRAETGAVPVRSEVVNAFSALCKARSI